MTLMNNSGFLPPAQPLHTGLASPVLMIELRKAITSILRRVTPKVYYGQAPEGEKYPYLVYLLNVIDQGDTKLITLDVDGWDAPENADTTQLEILMGMVDRELDRRVVNSDAAFSFVIYRDRSFPVEDSDKRIQRRKFIYEVRLIQRRSEYHGT